MGLNNSMWGVLCVVLLFTLACTSLAATTGRNSNEDSSTQDDSDLGISSYEESEEEEIPKVVRLVDFKHASCNKSEDYLVTVDDIEVTSRIAGDTSQIILNFDVDIAADLQTPIQADFRFLVRLGRFWLPLPIPCVKKKGSSCHFDDLCQAADSVPCPPAFLEAGLPCQCPVHKGKYSGKDMTFQLPSIVPQGAMVIVANITQGTTNVLCQQIYVKTQVVPVPEE